MGKISLTKGGNYNFELKKKGEELWVEGVFEVLKGQKLFLKTDMQFSAPKTVGKTTIKVVVHEGGYLDLRGKITITKKGKNADGFLKQRVLLLGKNAVAVVVPDLDIQTNEVKASHAAAVSQLDQAQLFYMMSRGIEESLAKEELVKAFLVED